MYNQAVSVFDYNELVLVSHQLLRPTTCFLMLATNFYLQCIFLTFGDFRWVIYLPDTSRLMALETTPISYT